MATEAGAPGPLEAASRRLDRALALLEERLRRRRETAEADAGGVLDNDRARLASELDEAKARERTLAEAGRKASAALGYAIAEIESELVRGEQWAS